MAGNKKRRKKLQSKKRDHQWIRVFGPDLQPQHKERAKKNQKTLRSEKFLVACSAAEVEPTKRQASKYRKGRGLAFNDKE